MKKVILILILLVLLMTVFCEAGKVPELRANEVDKKITLAVEQFEANRVSKGYLLLLEAMHMTVPHTDLPGDVGDRILKAAEHFRRDVPDADGFRLLREALEVIKRGKSAKVKVADSKTPAPVADAFQKKLISAREQIKEGNGDKAVELILEGILITSPAR
jgi:hypothetical protein